MAQPKETFLRTYHLIILLLALLAISACGSGEPDVPENLQVEGLSTTSSGLQYSISDAGSGAQPDAGDTVIVHYEGTLADGTQFDSSYDRGQPIVFTLGVGQVIPGWDEGIALLSEGSSATLIIPPNLAYGPQGQGPIPPDATLRFDVELLSVISSEANYDGLFEFEESELITTESGLQYVIVEEGDGPVPQAGDTVLVHYSGTLDDGTVFDSSFERGQPFSFPLGQGRVIQGWDEGIALLPEGSRATLIIPPELGYGANGQGPIPANATLRFDVELVAIIANQ
ncbi:MAG: FKBP-type peptidyl-prolyl cis-trans isomerase [Chloroflexi bacterium]|nr:FKBP-type peptidyl-prolyl cis-trans isomerase [Chloroflexota bacterium]